MWRLLKLAARAAVWRTTAEPPLVGLPVLLGVALVLAAVRLALQLVAAGSWHAFNPYGLNAVIAWIALELAVAALFIRPAGRVTALSAMFIFSILADTVTTAIRLGVPLLAPAPAGEAAWNGAVPALALLAIAAVWWGGAMVCVIGSLEWQTRLPLIGKVAGLWAALIVVGTLVPHAPAFVPSDFDARDANWWETLYALRHSGEARGASAELARIEKAQPAMLQAEIARLAPARKDDTDFYALGIAGWADQDVFVKELDGGLQSIASVIPIKDRTVRLINNRQTLDSVPLADLKNFEAAVHGIGALMDKDKDILVLFMTSHGERTGVALELPTATAELTPHQVAATLDGEGIKNRIVIVSACYAGIFVPPLQNDNTIIMTAADANNTSFGCAPERDWTYFGDALFRQSLHQGTTFESAFDHARTLIAGWELMDHAPPSNPQGHFGPVLVDKLAAFFALAASAKQ